MQGGVQGEQGGEQGEQGVKGVVQHCNVQGGVQQQRTLCGLLPDRRHRLQLHRACQHLHVKSYNCPCEISSSGFLDYLEDIYCGFINAMLIIMDPSTPIYSESKSSWLSF